MPVKTQNEITIFSVGLAGVSRSVQVPTGGGKVPLAARADHVADILDTLVIEGDVTETAPASFRAGNQSSSELKIDPAAPLVSVIRGLAGHEAVALLADGTTHTGAVFGVDENDEVSGTVTATKRSVVLLTAAGLVHLGMDSITSIRFTGDVAKDEIAKAAKTAAEKVKADSTIIELALAPTKSEGGTEAVMHYCIPAPVPMLTYRIIVAGEKCLLRGAAVIHNATDEDWTNAIFSVVFGAPLNYESNTNQRIIPPRPKRFFGNQMVAGGHQADTDLNESEGYETFGAPAAGMSLESTVAKSAGFYRARGPAMASARGVVADAIAPTEQASAREVGDFCQITAESPKTIPANRSALVVLFTCELKDAIPVLIYNAAANPTRPMRAVRFKNDTPYSLPEGSCGVFIDGLAAGKAAMPDTKSGRYATVTHAVENSVRVKAVSSHEDSEYEAIEIGEGSIHARLRRSRTGTYTAHNDSGRPAKLLIDHSRFYQDGTYSVSDGVRVAETEGGLRLEVLLAPEPGPQRFTITESRPIEEKLAGEWGWIERVIMGNDLSPAKDPQIVKIEEVREAIAEIDRKEARAKTAVANAEAEQKRVLPLFQNVKDGQDGAGYRQTLSQSEAKIREGRDTLAMLAEQKKDLMDQQTRLIKAMRLSWRLNKAGNATAV